MQTMNRRAVLAGAATASAAVGLGLAGCRTTSEPTGNDPGTNASVVLPNYVPVELATPDLQGTETVLPGYFAYPRDPAPVFDSPPGAGLDSVSIMYTTYLPSPGSAEQNSFWGQLQEDIGCTVALQPIASGDYPDKFQTMLAGGDLPDVMNLPAGTPDQRMLMEKVFADLGPSLSGSAVEKYPYLANIPQYSWKGCKFNGTIQAIPQPRPLTGDVLMYRADIFAEKGIDPEPTDWTEFEAILDALTDRGAGTFAFTNVSKMRNRLGKLLGGPNGWKEEGGVFTPEYLDPTYRESLEMMPDLVKQYAHPDSATATYAQFRDLFFAGAIGLLDDGAAGWDLYVRSLKGADKLGLMIPPKFEGGGPAIDYAGKGFQGISVINKDVGEERLDQILQVLNFLAAPIGSAEHLRRKFGVAEKDWQWAGDLPELTDAGNQAFIDVQYIVDSPIILGPGPQAEVEQQYAWHEADSQNLVANPTIGLWSDTNSSKGPTINRALNDVITGVMFGRSTMDDFDTALAKWRKDGGDQIAEEYGQAFAAEQEG